MQHQTEQDRAESGENEQEGMWLRVAGRAFQWYCISRAVFTLSAQVYSDELLGDWNGSRDMELLPVKGVAYKKELAEEQHITFADINLLLELVGRFDLVQLDYRLWHSFIRNFDRLNTLFYVAPDDYFHEHKDLARRHVGLPVRRLLDLRGTAILFGRERVPYSRLEAAGWEKQQIEWISPCIANRCRFRLHRVGPLNRGL